VNRKVETPGGTTLEPIAVYEIRFKGIWSSFYRAQVFED